MSKARRDIAYGEWDAGPPTTRLTPLSRSECEELLAANAVGRIAWHASTGLQLLPISYAWHDGQIVFRTSPQGVLAELARAGTSDPRSMGPSPLLSREESGREWTSDCRSHRP